MLGNSEKSQERFRGFQRVLELFKGVSRAFRVASRRIPEGSKEFLWCSGVLHGFRDHSAPSQRDSDDSLMSFMRALCGLESFH